MPDKPLALSTIPQALPAEADYDFICATVMATVRGRWFLEEYAKRNRNADTLQVLAAIGRLETAMAGDRAQQASQSVRIELLEMARTIARTRAAVAEDRVAAPPAVGRDGAPSDVAAAAERLRDIAWSMRACGVELATSDQIEALAATILSASPLHNPADHRAQKLAEALQYLEFRIDRMLDSHALIIPAEVVEAPPAALLAEAPAMQAPPVADEGSDSPVEEAAPPAAEGVVVGTAQTEAELIAAFKAALEPPPDAAADSEAVATSTLAPASTVEVLDPPAPSADDFVLLALDFAAEEPRADLQTEELQIEELRVEELRVEELRVERVEIELEPLVVVPAGEALRADLAREPSPPPEEPETIAAEPEPAPAVDLPPMPTTGDSALDAAFVLPEAAVVATDAAAAEMATAASEAALVETQIVENQDAKESVEPDAVAQDFPIELATLIVAPAPVGESDRAEASDAPTADEPPQVPEPEQQVDPPSAPEAEIAPLAAATADNPVARQVDRDLAALGMDLVDLDAPVAAAPPQPEPPAAVVPPPDLPPVPPPVSEALSEAWETAVARKSAGTADVGVAAPPHEPVPSMWDPPPEPPPAANDAPAEFLFEPLSTHGSEPADVEDELFAVAPAALAGHDATSAPAIAATAEPTPVALTAMSEEERIALFT